MANIRQPKIWDESQNRVTPESVFLNRRQLLALAGVTGVGSLLAAARFSSQDGPATQPVRIPASLKDLYPAKRNDKYKVDRAITDEKLPTTFNNFYEFNPNSKTDPAVLAQKLVTRPWEITIAGLVKKPLRVDPDELQRRFALEERVYRLRCVEAWSMTIPWIGFPMSKLIKWVEPLGSAKFVRFVSFLKPDIAPGQHNKYYKWPYYEALRMDEAMNELALFVTGMYGKPLPKQSGAPLRAINPWKYGYKSPKSIVRIEFTEKQPGTFWNDKQPREYSFLSNVDPKVPHPRWSQASERVVETGKRVPTLAYNGYGEYVAELYK